MSEVHTEPKLTVFMPVYNGEQYVGLAIESILAQSLVEFELLIIDDGSDDASLRVIQSFACADSRIRVVTRPNKGLVETLNEALTLARTELVARMDADDIAHHRCLEREVKYMEEHPDCVAVGGQAILIDPDGRPICPWPVPLSHDEIDRRHLYSYGGGILHSAMVFKKSAVLKVGGYRGRFTAAEDYDLWLRLAEVGQLANIPEVVLKYRQHLGSVCHKTRMEQSRSVRLLVEEAYQRRGIREPVDLRRQRVPSPGEADEQRRWISLAFKAGVYQTARRHAFRVWRKSPWKPSSWALLLVTLLGRHGVKVVKCARPGTVMDIAGDAEERLERAWVSA